MGLSLLLSSCAAESKREAPTAVNGVIDLSDWDFERDGPVELIGEWKVHLGRLLALRATTTGRLMWESLLKFLSSGSATDENIPAVDQHASFRFGDL